MDTLLLTHPDGGSTTKVLVEPERWRELEQAFAWKQEAEPLLRDILLGLHSHQPSYGYFSTLRGRINHLFASYRPWSTR